MHSEAISLFYDEPERAPAPVRERTTGDGMRRVTRDGTTVVEDWAAVAAHARAAAAASAPPAPEPGQLVRWIEGGIPHVGRVESVTDTAAMLTYGPKPHRARIELDELEVIDDKDGQGRPR